jgi:hypothetical protein
MAPPPSQEGIMIQFTYKLKGSHLDSTRLA